MAHSVLGQFEHQVTRRQYWFSGHLVTSIVRHSSFDCSSFVIGSAPVTLHLGGGGASRWMTAKPTSPSSPFQTYSVAIHWITDV